jgi:hypothetical protein
LYDVPPYPLIAAVAASAAYVFTDRKRVVQLSPWVSNSVAIAICGTIVYESVRERTVNVMTLAHFLVYLQVAKGFRTKRSSDLWMLYALSILQLIVGCVVNRSVGFGLLLFSYAFVATLTLGLHHWVLARGGWEPTRPGDFADRAALPVVPRRLRIAVLGRLTAIWLAGSPIAMLLFWLVPRPGQHTGADPFGAIPASAPVTAGFATDINLNDLGQILDNEDVVLNVWCRDPNGANTALPDPLLWRGMVYTDYREHHWQPCPSSIRGRLRRWREERPAQPGQVELRVEQLSESGGALFCPQPIHSVRLEVEGLQPLFVPSESRLMLSRAPRAPTVKGPVLAYTLVTDAHTSNPLSPVDPPPSDEYLGRCRVLPPGLDRLAELARSRVEGLPENDDRAKIDQLMTYLTGSGEFEYSLDARPVDRNLDPIEDFLLNRKEGHCEFFSSALALMLRAINVPARVVNGFVGGTYNATGRFYQIRKLYAHSWVEAYLSQQQSWLTLDPTPAQSRAAVIAQRRSALRTIRELFDTVARWWQSYVVGFSDIDQQQFLYDGLKQLRDAVFAAGSTWTGAVQGIFGGFDLAGQSPQGDGWILVVGLAISLAAAFIAGRRALVALLDRRHSVRRRSGNARLAVYERWVRLLARYGLDRKPHQTPLEFAGELSRKWHGDSRLADCADLPMEIAGAYYQVRFGGRTVEQPKLDDLAVRLERLRARL